MDDFARFREKKLAEKRLQLRQTASTLYEFKVAEEGKAKGLVSHRTTLVKISPEAVPRVPGFQGRVCVPKADPETMEKFQGKKLWGDDIEKVPPDTVPKLDLVSHIAKTEKIDVASLDKPPGIKRY